MKQKSHSFLQNKAWETGTPFHGHFELTPLCNLDCKMCYVHLRNDQMMGKQLLSPETWIDLIRQSCDAGMVNATLSGGECFTYPWFDEVFLFLKSKGIITTILTNGVLLDQQRIDFFKIHMPHQIQISLYGSTEDAYERVTGRRLFSTVFSNIKMAMDAKLPIKIAITLLEPGDMNHSEPYDFNQLSDI